MLNILLKGLSGYQKVNFLKCGTQFSSTNKNLHKESFWNPVVRWIIQILNYLRRTVYLPIS